MKLRLACRRVYGRLLATLDFLDSHFFRKSAICISLTILIFSFQNCKEFDIRIQLSTGSVIFASAGDIVWQSPAAVRATTALGVDCETGALASVLEYKISVSSLMTGSVAANSVANFANSAATIASQTSWTSVATKYILGSDYRNLIAQSKYCSRDIEIDTWVRNGIIYLRLNNNGDALYFEHNGDTPGGSLQIGIVKSYKDGLGLRSDGNGTYYPLYTNKNLEGTVPGYSKFPTDEHHFTFGAEGVDIYVKFNGAELIRIQEYRHMSSGRAAIQGNKGYGFRNVNVRHLVAKELLSDFAIFLLDPRDFGFRDLKTTGSIDGSSNLLRISSNPGIQIGDYVIVEIGGESGTGKRGTVGVGGVWPKKFYSDFSAMQADVSQPNGFVAWLQTTGDTYYFDAATMAWNKIQKPVTEYGYTHEESYYVGKALPLALRAQVLKVSADGSVLMLSNSASVSASKANVYLDNSYVLNKLGVRTEYDYFATTTPDPVNYRSLGSITPENISIRMPSGRFAIGERIDMQSRPGISLSGNGIASTTLMSPKGTPSASISFYDSPRSSVHDFTLIGNFKAEGYGLMWWSYHPDMQQFLVTQTKVPGGRAYPRGIEFYYRSDNSVGKNLRIIDAAAGAFVSNVSSNVWGYNIEVVSTMGTFQYIGWMIQWADSVGGGCVDCSVTSATTTGGFEAFKSVGTQFINPVGRNALFAMNDAGGWLIKNADLSFAANSLSPIPWSYPGNPMVNINTNIGSNYASQGGTIENIRMTAEGYLNANNDMYPGINVNGNNSNVSILGGLYTGPDYRSPSNFAGPQGVVSTGQNTIVDGMQVVGKIKGSVSPNIYTANIGITSGIVRNCVSGVIIAPNVQ